MEALLAAQTSDYSPSMAVLSQPGKDDEAGWIEKAQQADAGAFEKLYRMHIDKVYGLCLRMTGNVAEAEDCAQEAFIQAWNKLDKFRGESAFATWLHRIAVNSVLGRMRKSKREQDRIQLAGEAQVSPASQADSGELRDLSDALVGIKPKDAEETIREFYVEHGIESPGVEPADFAKVVAG